MTNRQAPKALILEGDASVGGHLESILTKAGWEVVCVTDSQAALYRLRDAVKQPFPLFVCGAGFAFGRDTGLLDKAGRLSPLTQRMLMVPADKPDILITAVNKSDIEACITYSYKDRDVVEQADTCLGQFRSRVKEERMKRVVGHQNKKMFQIARTLKQKDESIQARISEKKAERLMLKSRLRKAEKAGRSHKVPSLADRVETLGIGKFPESFAMEFTRLDSVIGALFNRAAAKAGLPTVSRLREPGPVHGEWEDLLSNVLKIAYLSPETGDDPSALESEAAAGDSVDRVLQATVSEDRVTAYIEMTADPGEPEALTPATLLAYLRDRGITYGIVDDDALRSWIETARPGDERRIVARGDPPKPGRDGKVAYHFEIDYTNPGRIQADGTIDFRERGKIPYVHEGDLLAEKEPAGKGKNGTSVSGDILPCVDASDPLFSPGPGTRLSEDGLSIIAVEDGQPHVEVLGTVSVNSELTIKGDVDFNTGNINFDGNIIVLGTVKDGFRVKGVHLTAREIQGGIITVRGDVCVSAGITNADIRAQGNVYAKYVNHAGIRTFGDVIIQREIIDSSILTSGGCRNTGGRIIASRISAKGGIEAGHIGTDASGSSVLTVGRDDYAELLYGRIDEEIEVSLDKLAELREGVRKIGIADNSLYGEITQKAQVQEDTQRLLKQARRKLKEMTRQDILSRQSAAARIRKLSERSASAEADLDRIFEIQDKYARQMDDLKAGVEDREQANKKKVLEKKAIREYSDRKAPLARVGVRGRIIQGTEVRGPNTCLTLIEDRFRCQIVETVVDEDGLHFHDMKITELSV